MTDHWYALHVKPRFERYVTEHLVQKGYETFLPTSFSKRQWSDRIKTLSFPLFPGYTFCRFDASARRPIVVTPGVMMILGAGRLPAPVDETEIAAIRHVIDSGVPAVPCAYLAAGEKVRVESGPLAGLVGIVDRIKGKERLVVSVVLLMRSVAVEIDRNCVRPLVESQRSGSRNYHSTTEDFELLPAFRGVFNDRLLRAS
jgi:transcription antitermination factor NusG